MTADGSWAPNKGGWNWASCAHQLWVEAFMGNCTSAYVHLRHVDEGPEHEGLSPEARVAQGLPAQRRAFCALVGILQGNEVATRGEREWHDQLRRWRTADPSTTRMSDGLVSSILIRSWVLGIVTDRMSSDQRHHYLVDLAEAIGLASEEDEARLRGVGG